MTEDEKADDVENSGSTDEAKQLDSVTDMVQEQELDASTAQQAMSALSSDKKKDDGKAIALAAVVVSKEDIAIVVEEMEVSEELAERVLREVAVEGNPNEMVQQALRKLVTT
jgi:NACalpha-BTF3-like transcription factor